MHHTGKKTSKKRDFLKKQKNNGYQKFAWGDSNPDPQNQWELKVNASIHWSTPFNADKST